MNALFKTNMKALIYLDEMQTPGYAVIYFNMKAANPNFPAVEVQQAKHQQATEAKLLKAVQVQFPNAELQTIIGAGRCIVNAQPLT